MYALIRGGQVYNETFQHPTNTGVINAAGMTFNTIGAASAFADANRLRGYEIWLVQEECTFCPKHNYLLSSKLEPIKMMCKIKERKSQ